MVSSMLCVFPPKMNEWMNKQVKARGPSCPFPLPWLQRRPGSKSWGSCHGWCDAAEHQGWRRDPLEWLTFLISGPWTASWGRATSLALSFLQAVFWEDNTQLSYWAALGSVCWYSLDWTPTSEAKLQEHYRFHQVGEILRWSLYLSGSERALIPSVPPAPHHEWEEIIQLRDVSRSPCERWAVLVNGLSVSLYCASLQNLTGARRDHQQR